MNLLWLTIAPLDKPGFRATQFGMAIAMEKIGWKVHLMGKAAADGPFSAYEGFTGKVTAIPRKGRFFTEINYHTDFWRALLSGQVDVVMFEPPQLRLAALPALASWAGFGKIKFVMDVRTPLVEESLHSRLEQLNYRLAMRFAKWFLPGVTVITDALRHDLEPFWGNSKPVSTWGSGVDPEVFSKSSVQPVPKSLLNLENRFVFLHHGSLSMEKGLQPLVEAMKPLTSAYPAAALLILGDGPAREQLLGLVRELGLQDSVFFVPAVQNHEVPRYIAAADVGVIPIPADRHWQVSSPLKLFEYMAMELPVIVSDIEAHRAVLGKLPFAVYLETVSREGICAAMMRAIERIDILRAEARGARAVAVREHSWDRRAAELSGFLSGLAASKKVSEAGYV